MSLDRVVADGDAEGGEQLALVGLVCLAEGGGDVAPGVLHIGDQRPDALLADRLGRLDGGQLGLGALGAALPHEPIPGREHNWVPVSGALGPARRRLESLAVMRRGSVAFHHPLTLHGSAANRSERWRRAHSSQWVIAEARCTGDLLEWAYSRTVGAGRHPFDCP